MKRFRFALERVVNLKKQRERLAEMRQSQARNVVREAIAECARLEEELAREGVESEASLRDSVALGTWRARYERAAYLSRLLEMARQKALLAQRQLEEADRQRVLIAKEVEALVVLRRRQWEAYQEQAAQRGQQVLDAISLERWLTQQRAGRATGAEGRRETLP